MTQVQAPPPPSPVSLPPAPNADASGKAGNSKAKTVVMWLLVAGLFLLVLPILALRVLGAPVESASDLQVEQVLNTVSGDVYVDDAAGFSLTTDTTWTGPEVQPEGPTAFMIPEFSTNTFGANVVVWNDAVDPQATLQQISDALLQQGQQPGVEVATISERNRNIDGELIREQMNTIATSGLELRNYVVVHKNDDSFSVAILTTDANEFDAAFAAFESHLLTVRALD